jgi:hypothetical protein
MIDLEDAQIGVRIAIGEGVEAGAQNNELAHAALDGRGDRAFGEAGAGGDEEAHVPALGVGRSRAGYGPRTFTQDWDGQRILKDTAVLKELMGRAMSGGV